MANVLRVDASLADAWAEKDLGADQPDVWVTLLLRFGAAAFAQFQAGFSGYFVQTWDPAHATFSDYVAIDGTGWLAGWASGNVPPPAADTWLLVELHHVNGGAADLYVNSTLVGSGVDGLNLDTRFITIGIVSGDVQPEDIVYIADVRVGTTRLGSDLFADDFASGDLSAWTSTSGDVSVIENPFGPPPAAPTQVFGGSRFYEAPPWRIAVSDLDDNILTFLDRQALDRSVTVTRAAARVMSGRVNSDNPEINIPAPDPDGEPFLSEGTRIVSWFRREAPGGSAQAPWVIRGRGLVLTLEDDADTDHATSTFTAYDPWKYLYRRPLLTDGAVPGDVSYPAGTRANEIIIDQLTSAVGVGGTIFTDFGQTAFYTGTIENTDPLPNDGDGLAMTFRSGTTLGEMLDLLVATGTCDVVFDPIYDITNRPGLLCELSIYQSAGSFRPNAVMGWDRWPRSLVQLSRQVDGTERADIVQMYAGQGGPPVPLEFDAAAVGRFGQYWLLQYLPGVPSLAGAHTIAQRQLALLKDGLYTYTLSPASERAPLLFEEYREADTVPVYASERFREPISGVPVRVESIPIVIGDDELERVNQMLVSFAPESGS